MIKLSDVFIFIAVGTSLLASTTLWFTGHQALGIFTAIWVPSILAFAIYFKLLGLIRIVKIIKKRK